MQQVVLRRRGAIAELHINRPQRHNSLVPELLEPLRAELEALAGSDAAVVVLTAAGRSFSTGGDLQGFLDHWDDIVGYSEGLVGQLNEVVMALAELPQPVVAAVQGWTTGGALGLVLASDVVVAAEDARFAPYYVDVGFSPDGGWCALLPEFIGRRRAALVQYENRVIEVDHALAWGLINEAVPAAELEHRAFALAESIARRVAHSVTSTKRLLLGDAARWRVGLEAERRAFVAAIQRPGVQQRVREFVSRHQPRAATETATGQE